MFALGGCARRGALFPIAGPECDYGFKLIIIGDAGAGQRQPFDSGEGSGGERVEHCTGEAVLIVFVHTTSPSTLSLEVRAASCISSSRESSGSSQRTLRGPQAALAMSPQTFTNLAAACGGQIGVEFGTKIISLGNRQIKLQPESQF